MPSSSLNTGIPGISFPLFPGWMLHQDRLGYGSSTQGKTGTWAEDLFSPVPPGEKSCESKSLIFGKNSSGDRMIFPEKKIRFGLLTQGDQCYGFKNANILHLCSKPSISCHNFGAKPVNYHPALNRLLKPRARIYVPRIPVAPGEKIKGNGGY